MTTHKYVARFTDSQGNILRESTYDNWDIGAEDTFKTYVALESQQIAFRLHILRDGLPLYRMMSRGVIFAPSLAKDESGSISIIFALFLVAIIAPLCMAIVWMSSDYQITSGARNYFGPDCVLMGNRHTGRYLEDHYCQPDITLEGEE